MSIKLSETQLKVLVELNSTGKLPKGVRPRTIEILREGKFIDVTRVGDEDPTYILRTEGKKEIGISMEGGQTFHEKLMADVAELEKGLAPEMWKIGEQITQDEVYIDLSAQEWDPHTFNKDWALWERELAGFEVANLYRNTDVWHGLTAQEIKEDMKTARPIGREGRRRFERQVRKVTKQLVAAL